MAKINYSVTKFELNYEGVGELLKSKQMQKLLRSYADRIAGGDADNRAGVYMAKTRAVATVTGTNQGNSLLKAMR